MSTEHYERTASYHETRVTGDDVREPDIFEATYEPVTPEGEPGMTDPNMDWIDADATPIEDRGPTTDEVRERFVDGFPMDTWVVSRAQCAAEFDRWLAKVRAETLREAAHAWLWGGWGGTPRHADRVADRMAASQFAGDWLRERADRIEKGDPK